MARPSPDKAALAHDEALHARRRGDARVWPTYWDPTVLAAFCNLEQSIAALHGDLEHVDHAAAHRPRSEARDAYERTTTGRDPRVAPGR